jgi:type 1 glutamine amidotransferase/sugar phosphate isomerase/epimerase
MTRALWTTSWQNHAFPLFLICGLLATNDSKGQDPDTALSDPRAVLSAEDQQKIENAIPDAAPAKPRQSRRLLIFNRNVNYGGHASIPHASLAFQKTGKKTGAFEAVISSDPQIFQQDQLRQFDAVLLNNTVGNLFEDPQLRKNLVEFVYGGGGLMGLHGTSVAFTRWPGAHEDWPEFGRMLGARGAAHRDSDERVIVRVEQPAHPVTRVFEAPRFEYRDEFFRFHDPYSRHRVRVLLSIDTEKTDLRQGQQRGATFREDNDYALAWVRHYGRGRVFYSTIAHNPYVFWDAKMLKFYLAATQFALGDLPAPTVPSARVTPAIRAREQLGWRLGITAYTFHKYSLFEAIDKTAQLGLPYFGGLSFQKVSDAVDRNFDPQLDDDTLRSVRLKLDAAGVRMLTYYIHRIPADEEGCRKVFEFGRKMGIKTFISEPLPEALDTIEQFCDEYDIQVAIHNHGPDVSPEYWDPAGVLKVCQDRSPRIGACGDVGYWIRNGVDPRQAVRQLGKRLITLQLHDLHENTPEGHDVVWGTGSSNTELLLQDLHEMGIRPTMFGLEFSYDWFDSMPELAECVSFFDRVSLDLASSHDPR